MREYDHEGDDEALPCVLICRTHRFQHQRTTRLNKPFAYKQSPLMQLNNYAVRCRHLSQDAITSRVHTCAPFPSTASLPSEDRKRRQRQAPHHPTTQMFRQAHQRIDIVLATHPITSMTILQKDHTRSRHMSVAIPYTGEYHRSNINDLADTRVNSEPMVHRADAGERLAKDPAGVGVG